MGLFKEAQCACCGGKTNGLTRKKLRDGNYLCSTCKGGFPSYIDLSEYTLEEYNYLKEYIEYAEKTLKPRFKQTHKYNGLCLDQVNGLFYMEEGLFHQNNIIFSTNDVEGIDIEFDGKKFEKGVFAGGTVTGDVYLTLTMSSPAIINIDHQVLESNATAKGKEKKGIFSDKVQYDNPKGMDEFIQAFLLSRSSF